MHPEPENTREKAVCINVANTAKNIVICVTQNAITEPRVERLAINMAKNTAINVTRIVITSLAPRPANPDHKNDSSTFLYQIFADLAEEYSAKES